MTPSPLAVPGAKTAARAEPTASSIATASDAQSSRDSVCGGTWSDSPKPRWSNLITRQNDAKRRWKRAMAGSSSTQSIGTAAPVNINRSSGPSPKTWYARSMPSLLA